MDFDPKMIGQVPEQLRKDSRAADKEDRERAELFSAMVRTPAWAAYTKLLESFIQKKSDIILQPSGSVDGAIVLEYEKGAMSGLLIAKDLPSLIITQSKSLTSEPDTEE